MNKFIEINKNYFVSGQLQPEDIILAKECGIKSIICNRPDDEESEQLKAQEVGKLAQEQGMQFVAIPISKSGVTYDNIDEFALHYPKLPKPVLAYCRSGGRATMIYKLFKANEASEQ